MSYVGLNLLLNLALPIAFATIAQMFVITVNDLDLSLGAYVGFVACVGATWLTEQPLLGIAALAGGILIYAAVGALIHLRNLPSIVVTLGMSFVWLGLAILVLPTPGGKAPDWLRALMTWKTPFVPFTIYALLGLAMVVHFGLMRSAHGTVLRGVGGNPRSVERAGWSLLKAKMIMFTFAGLFGMLSGLSLVGLTTSGDANIALRYTLLSIAGVILGGGEFTGRPHLAGRRGHRRNDVDPCWLFSVIPTPQSRLADRCAGRDPHPGAGAARVLNRAEVRGR